LFVPEKQPSKAGHSGSETKFIHFVCFCLDFSREGGVDWFSDNGGDSDNGSDGDSVYDGDCRGDNDYAGDENSTGDEDCLFDSEDDWKSDSLSDDDEVGEDCDGCDDNNIVLTEQQKVILKLLKSLFLWQMTNYVSDCSINKMLVMFKVLLGLINTYLQNNWLQNLIIELPTSIYTARKYLGIERDSFKKLLVCPAVKCQKTFLFEDSYQIVQGM